MAKRTPVLAAHVDTRLKTLTAILEAGGERDGEIEIDGYVWPHRAKRQLADGKLRAITDSAGEVVAFKRVGTPAVRVTVVLRSVEWRKTPSGPVDTMQLVRVGRGRKVPATQAHAAV